MSVLLQALLILTPAVAGVYFGAKATWFNIKRDRFWASFACYMGGTIFGTSGLIIWAIFVYPQVRPF